MTSLSPRLSSYLSAVIKQNLIVTCNFTAAFSIDSASQKMIVKHTNDDHVTMECCNTYEHPPAAKHPNLDRVTGYTAEAEGPFTKLLFQYSYFFVILNSR